MSEIPDSNFREQSFGVPLGRDKTPKAATQTDGAGNFPPVKTAVSASDGGLPHYRVGEQLECRILAIRPGGYQIRILKDGIEGYLKSTEIREVGSVFVAQFLLWQDKQKK